MTRIRPNSLPALLIRGAVNGCIALSLGLIVLALVMGAKA